MRILWKDAGIVCCKWNLTWSSDEQMILYLWMVPFLKSSPGGSQASIIVLELVALKVMFSGIAVLVYAWYNKYN